MTNAAPLLTLTFHAFVNGCLARAVSGNVVPVISVYVSLLEAIKLRLQALEEKHVPWHLLPLLSF